MSRLLIKLGMAARSQRSRLFVFALLLSAAFGATGCGGGSSAGGKAGAISIAATGEGSAQIIQLSTNATYQVSVSVSGNGADDGVNWIVLCGGSPTYRKRLCGACGSFAPTHTPSGAATIYTAPALIPLGTTVTLVGSLASNPSATSSLTLPIAAPPVQVALVSAPVSVVEGGRAIFASNISNDLTGAGVTWTATCSFTPCGSFNPVSTPSPGITVTSTYTAPTSLRKRNGDDHGLPRMSI